LLEIETKYVGPATYKPKYSYFQRQVPSVHFHREGKISEVTSDTKLSHLKEVLASYMRSSQGKNLKQLLLSGNTRLSTRADDCLKPTPSGDSRRNPLESHRSTRSPYEYFKKRPPAVVFGVPATRLGTSDNL
jgi:hypothetical protein